MNEFHFLRPWWLWALIPAVGMVIGLLKSKQAVTVWSKICDAHLLQPLLISHGRGQRSAGILSVFLCICSLILALAGPTWSKIMVPTYQHLNPHLILLDLSNDMLMQDLSPDRLTRAKFKIHDLLTQPQAGQFGLMVYSSEPFVVSPLTDDAQTIDILLSPLSPKILPVEGNRLDQALLEAKTMFNDIGLHSGQILVLTGQVPSSDAVDAAQKLGQEGYSVSIMPLLADAAARPLFAPLAKAGHGIVLSFTDSNADIQRWLALRNRTERRYQLNQQDDVTIWQDQGRWFLIPGLLLFLPMFRREWFERIGS